MPMLTMIVAPRGSLGLAIDSVAVKRVIRQLSFSHALLSGNVAPSSGTVEKSTRGFREEKRGALVSANAENLSFACCTLRGAYSETQVSERFNDEGRTPSEFMGQLAKALLLKAFFEKRHIPSAAMTQPVEASGSP